MVKRKTNPEQHSTSTDKVLFQDSTREVAEAKRKVFTSEEDVMLLREVNCERPFLGTYKEIPKKWENVQKHLKWEHISLKTIRGRFDILLAKFSSDERRSLLSSGSEESYDEKCKLLGHILELKKSDSAQKTDKSGDEKVAEDSKREQAMDVRDAAMNGMTNKNDKKNEVLKSKSTKSDEVIMEVYKIKVERENDSRKDELEFKKLKLQTLVEERQKDREVEQKRLEIQEKALDNQNSIMLALLQQISKK